MRIGFYLAYKPNMHYSMINEGLGRYLAKLISLLMEQGCDITIACPTWIIDPLYELFEEYDLPADKVEFIVPSSESALWKILKRFQMKKKKQRVSLKKKLYYAGYDAIENISDVLAKVRSNFVFFLLILAFVICGIILIPVGLLCGILFILAKIAAKLLKIDLSSGDKAKKSIKNLLTLKGLIPKLRKKLTDDGLFESMYEKIRMDTARDLIRRTKKAKNKADIWYCAMAFWPEFYDIEGVKVSCFPDITTSFFPAGFVGANMLPATNSVRKNVERGKYFITYCDYQKDQVLSANLGVERDHIRTIPLFVNETLPDIDVSGFYGGRCKDPVKKFAAKVMEEELPDHCAPEVRKYFLTSFSRFSFEDTKYIFYSSQCRPHKNILSLIKAYEYLLRTKQVHFKLFITAYLGHIPEVKEYVYSRRLQYDVVSFYNVNNRQLASLYARAELVVNPTLYEGGFLMIFSEGMSAGTPSVMSRIPQVTDITSGYDMDDCLFDPFDYMDIADKIMYGTENREALVKKQLPLYKALSAGTREEAGKDYLDAFRYFIELDKKKKKKAV